MTTTVSLLAEVPEAIHDAMKAFLESKPDWDQDKLFTVALSIFFLQNRSLDAAAGNQSQRQVSRIYLDNVFKKPAQPEATD